MSQPQLAARNEETKADVTRENRAEGTTQVKKEQGCAAQGKLDLFTLIMDAGSQLEHLT